VQDAYKSRSVNNYIKTQCFQVPTAPDPAFLDRELQPEPAKLGGPKWKADHD